MDRADKGEHRFDAAMRRRLMADKAPEADCPALELLAAYYDRTLPRAEHDRFETHLAECPRCQASLAAIARADGVDVSGSSESMWQRWMPGWRVAIPAMAAIFAIFVVTRVIRHPEEQNLTRMAEREKLPEAESSPMQLALSERKSAPVESEQETPKRAEAVPQHHKGRTQSRDFAGSAPLKGAREAERAPIAPSARAAAPPPASQVPAATERQIATGQLAKEPIAPEGPAPNAASGEATSMMQTAPSAAIPSLGAPGRAGAGAATGAVVGGAMASNAMHAASAISMAPIVIAAREGHAFWRLRNDGEVQFSLDGATWRSGKIGVPSELLAGSAPSESVCWAVGRNGTIIRTINSVDWQKLAPPTNADLINVVAENADAAQVFAADGSSFVTSDGGRSWVRK